MHRSQIIIPTAEHHPSAGGPGNRLRPAARCWLATVLGRPGRLVIHVIIGAARERLAASSSCPTGPPRLGTQPLTTGPAPDSPAPEGQQKAPSGLAHAEAAALCVECRVRALECELQKLRLVRSSGDIVYLHAVGKDCFSRSSNKAKGARGVGLRTAPPAFSRRAPFPPAQRRHRHLPLQHKQQFLKSFEQNCV